MEVKAGYKQTELDIIPEDWDVVSARDACSKIQDGTHFSPKVGGNDFLYVTSKNIRFGYLDLSSAGWIDKKQHEAIYRRCDVKKGDLLLTKDGANTGNAVLNTIDEEFSLLSSVAFLRFNPSKHCTAYFLQQVLSSQGQHQIQDAMSGNAITRLTLEKINKLKFPIPPTLAEQEAIAEALSDADALIEALEQLIAKKRQIKQGAMQELLTGRRRLPGFSDEWKVKTIGEIGNKFLNGGTPSTKKLEYWEGTIPWITGADIVDRKVVDVIRRFITDEAVKNSSTNIVEKGNLLVVTRTGVGKIAIAPFDLAISQDLTGVYVKREYALPEFLYWYFSYNTGSLRNLNQGTSIAGITRDTLMSLSVSLPSIREQTAIAEILSDMDAEIAALESKLVKARQVKQGMMSELLTGRVRLV